MTNPEQRPQHDRGYYGAGWQQQHQPPLPPQQPAGAQALGTGPSAPPRPPRRAGDPTRAFAPGASAATVAGAAIAVVGLIAIQAVSGLIGLLGTSITVSPFQSYGGQSVILSFATGVFLSPFPFYAGAFLGLAFLTPITRRSPLPVVLLRAVLGGAAGTVALALVGVFTGAYGTIAAGPGRLVIDVVTAPLQRGVPLTAMLLATATVAWLWLGRPRRARPGPRAGMPGTVRPADAVPPATVQPPQPSSFAPQPPQQVAQQQGHQQGQPYPQQQPYGQQPPANPWGPPPAR
ncbi:hypothetical protein AAEP80_09005 [Curtobacterium sp. L3-7]|uniref:hypothetical protein n=1 Tax=Curtobacterium sp. L3-7 TaxID=3138787 RepID=UPI003B51C9F2